MTTMVIDSIFESKYKNIEVIAVNDGSTDGTMEILYSLKNEKYPNLKIIDQKNSGKRKAVARGFKESTGNYIILIDSDSIIDRNAIYELVTTLDSNSDVGAVAGQAKIWNADNNILTRCQDAWYDYEYNIYKTCESFFGTVTCCSGCLAGYRREAIQDVLLFWYSDSDFKEFVPSFSDQNSNKKKNKENKLSLLFKSLFTAVHQRLLFSLLSYDDSEDRALTTFCLMKWKSVYVSTALVYTDVPETLSSYLKQQKRWKKGYLRANIFASTFLWSKKNPIISLLFYIGFILNIISPIITMAALFYGMFVLHEIFAPMSLIGGFVVVGYIEGLDYKMRDSNAINWKYRPLMNLILSFVVSWLIFYAIFNYKKNEWLTR